MTDTFSDTKATLRLGLLSRDPKHWAFLMMAGVILFAAIWLRLAASKVEFIHCDEIIGEVLLTGMLDEGRYDLNWNRPTMPDSFRVPQYNFSSYYYFCGITEGLRRFIWGSVPPKTYISHLRQLSLWLGVLLVLLIIVVAWRFWGTSSALCAGALAAINPLLVQDSLFARPESFLGVLILIAAALLLSASSGKAKPRIQLSLMAVASGLLGLGAACKVSVVPLLAIPLLLALTLFPTTKFRSLTVLSICSLAGFFLGAPSVLYNLADYIAGVDALRRQYSTATPPHSLPGSSTSIQLTVLYFLGTWGWSAAVLFLFGLYRCFSLKKWDHLIVFALPVFLTFGIMLKNPIFFERNYSHVASFAIILISLGVTFPRAIFRWACYLGVLLALVAAWNVTSGLIGIGRERMINEVVALRQELRANNKDALWIAAPLFEQATAVAVLNLASRSGRSIIVEVRDLNDGWTQQSIRYLKAHADTEELGLINGPFGALPPSTLQAYHLPALRYLRVRAFR